MLRRLFVSFVALLTLISLCFTLSNENLIKHSTEASADISVEKVVIIDAGHGGFDGGAVAFDGTMEKDLNLQIALKLGAVLDSVGYKTVMVRTDDVSTNDPTDGDKAKVSDIKNRVKLMKKYPQAVFVSVHMNKYSTTQPHGAQVFYADVDGSFELANIIQSEISGHLQTDNKRVIKATTSSIYLLKHATIPSVIVECGFLSNPGDLQNLKDNDYQLKLALSLAYGIIKFKQ